MLQWPSSELIGLLGLLIMGVATVAGILALRESKHRLFLSLAFGLVIVVSVILMATSRRHEEVPAIYSSGPQAELARQELLRRVTDMLSALTEPDNEAAKMQLSIDILTPRLRQRYAVPKEIDGLVVTRASRLRSMLQEGDVITEVDPNWYIVTPQMPAKLPEGKYVKLWLFRSSAQEPEKRFIAAIGPWASSWGPLHAWGAEDE